MATYPTLEPSGPAYRIQLWSGNAGGIPLVVGAPESPALVGLEGRLRAFAEGVAADNAASITSITRYATASTDVTVPDGV